MLNQLRTIPWIQPPSRSVDRVNAKFGEAIASSPKPLQRTVTVKWRWQLLGPPLFDDQPNARGRRKSKYQNLTLDNLQFQPPAFILHCLLQVP
jgi:hypothetical protein